jgi:hypothetical protein
MRIPAALIVLALAAAGASACGADVDPIEAMEPVDVVTGWFDAGILPDGKNKLVPSITLKLRNKAQAPITSVQINAIFRRVGEQEMWGEHYSWAVQRDALAPGAATGDIVLRSALGYTGEQPRMQILQHSGFVDARVELFLKKGSRTWAKLAEYPIQRQLLTKSRARRRRRTPV